MSAYLIIILLTLLAAWPLGALKKSYWQTPEGAGILIGIVLTASLLCLGRLYFWLAG